MTTPTTKISTMRFSQQNKRNLNVSLLEYTQLRGTLRQKKVSDFLFLSRIRDKHNKKRRFPEGKRRSSVGGVLGYDAATASAVGSWAAVFKTVSATLAARFVPHRIPHQQAKKEPPPG